MGGMGEVLLARAPNGQVVVLKRVLPHLASDPTFRAAFLAEAGVVAKLRHPNLARILELGDVDGQPFLAMEFVDGLTLAGLLEKASLTVELACRIGADVALALHHAHTARDAQGRALHVVHRDVSPRNVMVGVDGVVKLIDFGLAKGGAGTVAYRPPEDELDARSDQFSLGLVLWELLTGAPRFEGDDDAATLQQIDECAPRSLGPSFPAALDAVVARMLSGERAARFEDCAQVQQALVDFAGRVDQLAALVRPLVPTNDLTPATVTRDDDREARFVARARRVVRDFAMTDAARAVLARLESDAALRLVAGRTPALPGETSLEAIARWSWSALTPHEQLTLREALHWPVPFTLEHAEATLDLSQFAGAPWPLDVVQALGDRGWLETTDGADPSFSIPAELRGFVA
jgi:serine/threonine protein kinase